MTGVNLIPGPIQASRSIARRARLWCASLGVGGCVVGLAAGTLHLSAPGQTPVPAESGMVIRLEAREEQLKKVSREIAMLERTAAEKRLAPVPDWSLMMRGLAARRPGDVVLDAVEIGTVSEGATVLITGAGSSTRAVDAFVTALESLNIFDAVQQLENRTRLVDGEAVSGFRLRCVIHPGKHVASGKVGAE